jgi:hypothetical protein
VGTEEHETNSASIRQLRRENDRPEENL